MTMFDKLKSALETLRDEALERARRTHGAARQSDYYHFDTREPAAPAAEPATEVSAGAAYAAMHTEPAQRRVGRRARLRAKLREPGQLRDAMVINEILSPPLALRRRR